MTYLTKTLKIEFSGDWFNVVIKFQKGIFRDVSVIGERNVKKSKCRALVQYLGNEGFFDSARAVK